MIKTIHLQNFKCYSDNDIPFSNLTVFSGMNGVGKSTAIQAILLVRQIFFDNFHSGCELPINGDLVHFGGVNDLLSRNPREKDNSSIEIKIEDNNLGQVNKTILKKKDNERNIIHAVEVEHKINSSLYQNNFVYLSAERSGPRNSFSFPQNNKMNYLGNQGEYTSYFLSKYGEMDIKNLKLAKKTSQKEDRAPDITFSKLFAEEMNFSYKNDEVINLSTQIELWLKELGKSVRVKAITNDIMERSSLSFSFEGDKTWGPEYSPINVGFGLTYSLPIYVALLNATPDSIVIIENPEAHLHPKGQVAIGLFIAQAAASGVQVIIETHSDHVINGIRLAVKRELIKNTDIKLNFVTNDNFEGKAEIVSPNIMPSGRIDIWPEGFFDQFNESLAQLF